MGFTKEELAAMAAADREIEAGFALTDEERRESTWLDREAKDQDRNPAERKNANRCRAYYAGHREEQRAKQKIYRDKNRETINAKRREAYAGNLAARRAEARDRHQANPEKRRARDRDYYQRNREAVLARNKRYRDRRKERERER